MGIAGGRFNASGGGGSSEVVAVFSASTKNLESGLNRVQQAFGNTQRTIAGFIGAVSFVRVTRELTELAAESVKFERVESGFRSLATQSGLFADSIVNSVQRITQGQISLSQTMESLNKALTLLPESAERIDELATIAAGAAAALGLDVRRAFDDITTGIGRASPKILDNLGIIINAREAYSAYAAELGKSVTTLTSVEKQHALLEQVISRNIDRFSTIADSVKPDVFQQAGAAVKQLRIEVGELLAADAKQFIGQFGSVLNNTEELTTSLEKAADAVITLIQLVASLGGALIALRTGAAIRDGLIKPWQELNAVVRTTEASMEAASALGAARFAGVGQRGGGLSVAPDFELSDSQAAALGSEISVLTATEATLAGAVRNTEAALRDQNSTIAANIAFIEQETASINELIFSTAGDTASERALAAAIRDRGGMQAATNVEHLRSIALFHEDAAVSAAAANVLSSLTAEELALVEARTAQAGIQATLIDLDVTRTAVSGELTGELSDLDAENKKVIDGANKSKTATRNMMFGMVALSAAIFVVTKATQEFNEWLTNLQESGEQTDKIMQDAAGRAQELAKSFEDINAIDMSALSDQLPEVTSEVDASIDVLRSFRAVVSEGVRTTELERFQNKITEITESVEKDFKNLEDELSTLSLELDPATLAGATSVLADYRDTWEEVKFSLETTGSVSEELQQRLFGLAQATSESMAVANEAALSHLTTWENVGLFLASVWETIKASIVFLIEFISGLLKNFKGIIEATFDVIVASIKVAWATIVHDTLSGLNSIAMGLDDFINDNINPFIQAVSDFTNIDFGEISFAAEWADAIGDLTSSAGFELTRLEEDMNAAAATFDDVTQDVFQPAADAFNSSIDSWVDGIDSSTGAFQGLTTSFGDIADAAGGSGGAAEKIDDAFDALESATDILNTFLAELGVIDINEALGRLDAQQFFQEQGDSIVGFGDAVIAEYSRIWVEEGPEIATFFFTSLETLYANNEELLKRFGDDFQATFLRTISELERRAELLGKIVDAARAELETLEFNQELANIGVDTTDFNLGMLEAKNLDEQILLLEQTRVAIADEIKNGIISQEDGLEEIKTLNEDILELERDRKLVAAETLAILEDAKEERVRAAEELANEMRNATASVSLELKKAFIEGAVEAFDTIINDIIKGDFAGAASEVFSFGAQQLSESILRQSAARVGGKGVATAGATFNAALVGFGIPLIGGLIGNLFNKQKKQKLELSQPIDVTVINPITIKTPATTRALLSSGGTIFSSRISELINRGGFVGG